MEVYRFPDGDAERPVLSSQLLQYREGERPPNGPFTIAQSLLWAACTGLYEPLPQREVATETVNGLMDTDREAPHTSETGPAADGYVIGEAALVTSSIMRTNPQLRTRAAAAAAQAALQPERQPISEMNEYTVMAGLELLEAQLPEEAVEELDKDTSALIEGYGYVAATAAWTEHFALVRFATDRIDRLTSRLRGPEPDEAPSSAYLEAMAILHSSLAARAYALLRTYAELHTEPSRADSDLLLQAHKDESQVMRHFSGRSAARRIKVKRDDKHVFEYVSCPPQANSGYSSWDVRAMRYAMGYHFMNGTLDHVTTGSGARDFLEAVTSNNIASTAPTTAVIPLLGYLDHPATQALKNRILMPLPKSTKEALAHEAEQEQKAYKRLLAAGIK